MNASSFIKVDRVRFFDFIEREPDGRYEFVRGRIMQQQSGTLGHGQVALAFYRFLYDRLAAGSIVVSVERGVDTGETVRFPDVVVEPVGAGRTSLACTNPLVAIEVLSPTSEDRDLLVKPSEYLALPSLQAYIVASQDEPACFLWTRGADGRFPDEPATLLGDDKVIDIPALSLSIPLIEIYRGLFTGTAPSDKARHKD